MEINQELIWPDKNKAGSHKWEPALFLSGCGYDVHAILNYLQKLATFQ